MAWKERPRPFDWEGELGRKAPLEVEIGFGRSGYLARQAKARPEHDFVGIEAKYDRVAGMARRLAQSGPANLRLIRADAWVAFERLFQPLSLQRVYSLFPDPWPKPRHIRHRLFSRSFLKLLNSRLISDGEAFLVTDHSSYADWVCEQAPGCGFLIQRRLTRFRFNTEFERQWRDEGQQRFFEISFRKQEHLDVPLIEDVELREHCLNHFDFENFSLRNQRGEAVVQFKALKHYPESEIGKVVVVVAEGRLLQHVWIEVRRAGGLWTVRLDPRRSGGIVPTKGVQMALDLVREGGGGVSRQDAKTL